MLIMASGKEIKELSMWQHHLLCVCKGRVRRFVTESTRCVHAHAACEEVRAFWFLYDFNLIKIMRNHSSCIWMQALGVLLSTLHLPHQFIPNLLESAWNGSLCARTRMFLTTSDGSINNLLILLYNGQVVCMDFVLTCLCSRELNFV